jgi:ribosomal-protein-alanine N-acetyltransferase
MLTTARFSLIELTAQNANSQYLSWLSAPSIEKYITNNNLKLAELADFITDKQQDPNCLFLGIYFNELHIGNIKYERLPENHSIATMGILIGESNWQGKGVAGEVIKVTSAYLKSAFKLTHINLGVSKENTSAIKVYEKLGFLATSKGFFDFPTSSIEMILKL